MDGTLTKPNLDFKEMYERCGVPRSQDILEAIARMPPAEAAAANAVIDEMEAEGRRTLELFPGAAECCMWLQRHGIKTALVTRNTALTVAHLHQELWPAGLQPFAPTISRDDAGVPPKPDPTALHRIADSWGVDASDLLMIGDSVDNDISFGKAAGAATALVDSGRRHLESGTHEANFCVENLALLPLQLWQHYDLESNSPVTPSSQKFPAPAPDTPATTAAASGDTDTLAALPPELIDAADGSGNTPLIWAADAGHVNAVNALLQRGATVNAVGYLGATAVCRASRKGHVEVLRALFAAPGIDINLPNDKLQSPMHFAAFKKNPKAVSALLEHGANALVLDRKGRTPAEDTSDDAIRAEILEAKVRQMAA